MTRIFEGYLVPSPGGAAEPSIGTNVWTSRTISEERGERRKELESGVQDQDIQWKPNLALDLSGVFQATCRVSDPHRSPHIATPHIATSVWKAERSLLCYNSMTSATDTR